MSQRHKYTGLPILALLVFILCFHWPTSLHKIFLSNDHRVLWEWRISLPNKRSRCHDAFFTIYFQLAKHSMSCRVKLSLSLSSGDKQYSFFPLQNVFPLLVLSEQLKREKSECWKINLSGFVHILHFIEDSDKCFVRPLKPTTPPMWKRSQARGAAKKNNPKSL